VQGADHVAVSTDATVDRVLGHNQAEASGLGCQQSELDGPGYDPLDVGLVEAAPFTRARVEGAEDEPEFAWLESSVPGRVVAAIRECGDAEPQRESGIAGPLMPDIEVVAGPGTYAAHRSAQSLGGSLKMASSHLENVDTAAGLVPRTSMPEAWRSTRASS